MASFQGRNFSRFCKSQMGLAMHLEHLAGSLFSLGSDGPRRPPRHRTSSHVDDETCCMRDCCKKTTDLGSEMMQVTSSYCKVPFACYIPTGHSEKEFFHDTAQMSVVVIPQVASSESSCHLGPNWAVRFDQLLPRPSMLVLVFCGFLSWFCHRSKQKGRLSRLLGQAREGLESERKGC